MFEIFLEYGSRWDALSLKWSSESVDWPLGRPFLSIFEAAVIFVGVIHRSVKLKIGQIFGIVKCYGFSPTIYAELL